MYPSGGEESGLVLLTGGRFPLKSLICGLVCFLGVQQYGTSVPAGAKGSCSDQAGAEGAPRGQNGQEGEHRQFRQELEDRLARDVSLCVCVFRKLKTIKNRCIPLGSTPEDQHFPQTTISSPTYNIKSGIKPIKLEIIVIVNTSSSM